MRLTQRAQRFAARQSRNRNRLTADFADSADKEEYPRSPRNPRLKSSQLASNFDYCREFFLSALRGDAWRRIGVTLGGLALSAFFATAQTSPPNVSYFRSYVNDLPDQPLVTVTVTGAVGVACFTIEEILPGAALAQSISGGGVWLPALGAIRWGPFFNTVATNVSYRLTGPVGGTYPVNGGSWMDGQWYFSNGVTMVTVLPPGTNSGGGVPRILDRPPNQQRQF